MNEMFCTSTSIWVLRTPNAGHNLLFQLKQDRFTTCSKTSGTGPLIKGVRGGCKVPLATWLSKHNPQTGLCLFIITLLIAILHMGFPMWVKHVVGL